MSEVVIAGGGVMGASVAWHLASRGCRDVLVLDRAPEPGGGSTGRATGGFRTQFATEINIRLSLLSLKKLLRFPDEFDSTFDSGWLDGLIERAPTSPACGRDAGSTAQAAGPSSTR